MSPVTAVICAPLLSMRTGLFAVLLIMCEDKWYRLIDKGESGRRGCQALSARTIPRRPLRPGAHPTRPRNEGRPSHRQGEAARTPTPPNAWWDTQRRRKAWRERNVCNATQRIWTDTQAAAIQRTVNQKPKRTAVHIEQTAPLDPSHRFCPSLMENANNEFWKDTQAAAIRRTVNQGPREQPCILNKLPPLDPSHQFCRPTNFETIRRRRKMRKDVRYINNASYATNFETIRRRRTMRKDVRYINNASYATNFERIRRRRQDEAL